MFLSLTMKKVYLTAFVLVSSLGQPMPLFKKAQEDALVFSINSPSSVIAK